jgi:prepilin-type N-terminal cleavage/methylation domain-containing protein
MSVIKASQGRAGFWYWNSEGTKIGTRCQHISVGVARVSAFTLVEVIVVISIIALLMAILSPALSAARRQAYGLLGMRNQREIANAVNFYAEDNKDRYPECVATVGVGDDYNYSDPTRMTGNKERSPQVHRSMSAYLHDYMTDAKTMYCPGAPKKYKYLQEAWDAGDNWDNPDTAVSSDSFGGTYCFYWNYVGYLPETKTVFKGPFGPASMGTHSQLLVTDYFGYGHWRTRSQDGSCAYGSCDKLTGASVVEETWLLSSWWKVQGDPNEGLSKTKIRAGFVDGHVSTYSSSELVPMKVSLSSTGVPPYPDGATSPGTFYIPKEAAARW